MSYYNGVLMQSHKGLQEELMKVVHDLKISENSEILVLGSGYGSFDQRLLNEGYKYITSTDINEENFVVEGTNFIKLDFNKPFANKLKKRYDLIVCSDVIEHLHNPNLLMQEINKLLKLGGTLLLTTPNVQNAQSRINHLLFGCPTSFISHDGKPYPHITPVYKHILQHYSKKNGLEIVTRKGVCNFYQNFKKGTLKRMIHFLIVLTGDIILKPFMWFNQNTLKGLDSIYIIQKERGKE